MPVEMLSYTQLGQRLSCSPEAARALVKRLRLPRQKGNDGKVLVRVDLTEISHRPMSARSPAGHHPVTAARECRPKKRWVNSNWEERLSVADGRRAMIAR